MPPSATTTSRRLILTVVCLFLYGNAIQESNAFTSVSQQHNTLQRNRHADNIDARRTIQHQRHQVSVLHAASKKSSSSAQRADFEYQELKIQTKAMKDKNVKPSQLAADKRVELEGYVKRILTQRSSLVPLNQLQQALPETKWRLAFSTEPIMSEALPKDATIQLDFKDDTNVDYSLEFEKTLGLKRLAAKSSYTVDASHVNPGLVTIQYDSITTDVFGLKDIGVGAFGMLKGRANYIQTAYFDGSIWIEKGIDMNGAEYFNVYTLEKNQE